MGDDGEISCVITHDSFLCVHHRDTKSTHVLALSAGKVFLCVLYAFVVRINNRFFSGGSIPFCGYFGFVIAKSAAKDGHGGIVNQSLSATKVICRYTNTQDSKIYF